MMCCHECPNGLRVLGSRRPGVWGFQLYEFKTCTSLIVRPIFVHSGQLNMRRHERTFELADGGQLAGMGGQFAGICMLFVFLVGLLFSGLVCIMERTLRLFKLGCDQKQFSTIRQPVSIADRPLIEKIWLVKRISNCQIELNHQGQQR